MRPEVEAFKTAWADKDNRDQARQIAGDFVDAHPELITTLQGRTLDECVKFIDALRIGGLDEDVQIAEMYMLTYFDPQVIGGTGTAVIHPKNRGE